MAILNATQEQAADGTEIAGVQGLADVVAKQVVQPLDGFAVGEKTDAASGFDETTVMFEPAATRPPPTSSPPGSPSSSASRRCCR